MTKPIFEHRHFTWLAHWCANHADAATASALADSLADTNPRFDRGRFMSAATRKPSNWRDEARNNVVPA